jgi:hypothetical protein
MADDKKPTAAADAGSGKTLDKLLKGLDAMMAKVDSLTGRMDTFEKKKAGDAAGGDPPPAPDAPPANEEGDGKPVPVAADKKNAHVEPDAVPPPPPVAEKKEETPPPPPFVKKDAEPPTDQPVPAPLDKAADSTGDLNLLRKRLAELEARMPKHRTDHDLAADQARADSVAAMFGEQAPRPLIGDTRASYVLRNLEKYKVHSPAWKGIDLTPMSVDEKVLDIAADQIYAAAKLAASNPVNVPLGTLRAITTRRDTGHLETKFMGSPSAWMNRHAPNKRFVTAINLKKD